MRPGTKTIKIRNDRSDLIIVIISTQIEWKSGMKERKKKRKERKNDRIISEGDWSPTSPTNSNYLTSDRNDTKGYERFNSYLGHSLFCLITSLNSLSGGLHVKITKITSTCSQIDNSSSCSIKNKNNNCTFVCDVLFPLDTIFIAEKKKK